jgi:hypothetical protein
MLAWSSLSTLIPERERHIHGKIGQPISPDAIAIWRKKLSALECFAMEACLRRDLEELGYQLRFSSLAWRPLLDTTGWLLRSMSPLLRRGASYLQRRRLLSRVIYI